MAAHLMHAALISPRGIRLVDVPDPPPDEIRVPDGRPLKYRHWDASLVRRFVRQDAYSYIEKDAVESRRR